MSHVVTVVSVFAAFNALAAAQVFANSYDTQNVCPQLLHHANATGGESVNLPLSGGAADGTIFGSNEIGWWRISVRSNYSASSIASAKSTANETYPDAVANLWLDPFEGVNLNDGSNPFSACAYVLKTLPENTIRRAQDDDTSCEQTLSKNCVAALTTRAANIAQWLVANPSLGPFSNLTPPILGPICDTIAGELGFGNEDDFSSECRPYFFSGDLTSNDRQYPTWNRMQLSNNVTEPTNCSFYDGINGHTEAPTDWNSPPGYMFPDNGTSPVTAYDDLVHQVWPILTVIMPPANNSRMSSISGAWAKMTCLRASNITEGSRTPPPLPKPTAVHFPRSAAWYGVRVGVPVAVFLGLALAAIVGWCIWRRRRKAQELRNLPESKSEETESAGSVQKDGTEVYQLAGKQAPAQLQGNHKVEMSAGEVPRWAQGSDGKPQELMGSIPVTQQSKLDSAGG